MSSNAAFFLAYGFVLGAFLGAWVGYRATCRTEAQLRAAELRDLLREHAAPADPEARRRERLAYDTIYDERHPEEWTQ